VEDRRQQFPVNAPGIAISVTNVASAAVALPVGNNIRIVSKEGSSDAFVAVSTSNTVAATVPGASAARTCNAILGGEDSNFSLPDSQHVCYISAITASGTATLWVYVGEGQ
jgi:hypothetical protein